jgi:hypothetical protein
MPGGFAPGGMFPGMQPQMYQPSFPPGPHFGGSPRAQHPYPHQPPTQVRMVQPSPHHGSSAPMPNPHMQSAANFGPPPVGGSVPPQQSSTPARPHTHMHNHPHQNQAPFHPSSSNHQQQNISGPAGARASQTIPKKEPDAIKAGTASTQPMQNLRTPSEEGRLIEMQKPLEESEVEKHSANKDPKVCMLCM